MNLCVFCESSLDDEQEVVTLGAKGCEGIHGSSTTTLPAQQVHVKCRQRHLCSNVTYITKRTINEQRK